MSKRISRYISLALPLCVLYIALASRALAFPADFDGDGKSDLALYRPNGAGAHLARWYIFTSSGTCPSPMTPTGGGGCYRDWGFDTDRPITGDYDGDHRADFTVLRPSTYVWYTDYSSGAANSAVQFGLPGDVEDEGDINNDGRSEIMVTRPQVNTDRPCFVRYYDPMNGVSVAQYAFPPLVHNPGDSFILGGITANYDTGFQGLEPGMLERFRKTAGTTNVWDIEWQWVTTRPGVVVVNYHFEEPSMFYERPVVGRFFPSIAFASLNYFESGTWVNYDQFNNIRATVAWGLSSDLPVSGDFDGDGISDYVVWRTEPSPPWAWTFFMKISSGTCPAYTSILAPGQCYKQWGLAGDLPLS